MPRRIDLLLHSNITAAVRAHRAGLRAKRPRRPPGPRPQGRADEVGRTRGRRAEQHAAERRADDPGQAAGRLLARRAPARAVCGRPARRASRTWWSAPAPGRRSEQPAAAPATPTTGPTASSSQPDGVERPGPAASVRPRRGGRRRAHQPALDDHDHQRRRPRTSPPTTRWPARSGRWPKRAKRGLEGAEGGQRHSETQTAEPRRASAAPRNASDRSSEATRRADGRWRLGQAADGDSCVDPGDGRGDEERHPGTGECGERPDGRSGDEARRRTPRRGARRAGPGAPARPGRRPSPGRPRRWRPRRRRRGDR